MSVPSTMSAWQYATPATSGLDSTLTLNPSAPLPPLPADQHIRVKVLRMALNPVDYKIAESPLFSRLIGLPGTPGMDCVGRVVETSHPLLSVGDLVAVKHEQPTKYGTAAEYVVAGPKDSIAKVDEAGLRYLDELAGSGVAAGTAAIALKGMAEGAKVFINGSSGGVGVWAVQMAKAAGYTVVATCSARNVDLVKSLGADEVIDYTKTSVVDALKKNVAETGRKFDRAVDNVAADMQLYFKAHEYLDDPAAYYIIGGYPTLSFFLSALKVHLLPRFLGGGRRKVVRILGNGSSEELKYTVGLLLDSKINLPVQKFSFSEVPEAYKAMKSGRAVGKIVVTVAEE